MIKMAMINIHKRLKAEKDIIKHSKMILQVHDELVFDAHKDEVEILKKLVVEEMEKAMPMNVVIKAEVGTGDNWLEAH
jgi:DNA polymerase-1